LAADIGCCTMLYDRSVGMSYREFNRREIRYMVKQPYLTVYIKLNYHTLLSLEGCCQSLVM